MEGENSARLGTNPNKIKYVRISVLNEIYDGQHFQLLVNFTIALTFLDTQHSQVKLRTLHAFTWKILLSVTANMERNPVKVIFNVLSVSSCGFRLSLRFVMIA